MTDVSFKELYDQGRHSEVVALASKADIHPASDPANSFLVAASLLQLGHALQCRQVCEALTSVLANNPLFLSLYATCLRRLGELERSESVFRQALKQFPDLPYLNNNYANLLIEKGELDAARKILVATVERHPGYADAKANLQRLNGRAALPPTGPASEPAAQVTGQPAAVNPTPPSPDAGLDQSQATALASGPAPAAAASDNSARSSAAAESTTQLEKTLEIVDPLALAFSEEELEVEQRERLKRKAEVAARPGKAGTPNPPSLVALPPVPSKELQEELAKAGIEALIERQPEAALVLADLLNRLGADGRRDALKIAADAYLMLKNYPQAEISLLQLAASGTRLSGDQLLNLASLAINRHDPTQANHYLEQARKVDATAEQLKVVSSHLSKLNDSQKRLTFHPYKHPIIK